MQRLTEYDCRALLKKYKIPVPEAYLAKSEDDAMFYAKKIGFPVVLKLMSSDVLHKTDVGGVILNIEDPEMLRKSYNQLMGNAKARGNLKIDGILVEETLSGIQIIAGASQDPQFGSILMFGVGGIFVELLHDVSFRVIPITRHDAGKMISEIKAYNILCGARGQKPVNIRAISDTLLKISNMIDSEKNIMELDINPLFVNDREAVCGDARMIIA